MTRSLLVLALFPLGALAVDVSVDASAGRRPISPFIYGINFGSEEQLQRMGATVRRFGGNATSRYNWKNSTSNRAADWYFENIPDEVPSGFQSVPDAFVSLTKARGAQPLLTVPMIGYLAKDSPANHPFACAYKVSKYGAQTDVDPWDTDCGNGIRASDGQRITGNDPLDTSIAADHTWTRDWVAHLVGQFGGGATTGVRFYNLDNEPALWHETHRDVHPAPSTYAELKAKLEAHGAALKQADPGALTLGPAEWGWTGYFDSAAGERSTIGMDFVPWYLEQARAYETAHGVRILDFLDLHFYPQGQGVFSNDTSAATNALRLRQTRGLWDPSYLDESWITCCYGGVVRLIPRMREWVDQHYPGTRLAITEYNFGALNAPVGAITQAEVLGIFGREGLDLATLWDPPAEDSIGEDAFKLYRDYDGAGASFGDTSVQAQSAEPNRLSAYAAEDEGGRITVVLINKEPSSTLSVDLSFSGLAPRGGFRAFRFGSGGRLGPSGSGQYSGGALSRSLPPYTAELVELTPELFTPDGGTLPDAGTSTDGGTQEPWDGGSPGVDGGAPADGGEPEDEGTARGGCGCGAIDLSGAALGLLLYGLSMRRRLGRRRWRRADA